MPLAPQPLSLVLMGYPQSCISFLRVLSLRSYVVLHGCVAVIETASPPTHTYAIGLAVSSLKYETLLTEIRIMGRRFLRSMTLGASYVSALG